MQPHKILVFRLISHHELNVIYVLQSMATPEAADVSLNRDRVLEHHVCEDGLVRHHDDVQLFRDHVAVDEVTVRSMDSRFFIVNFKCFFTVI